MVHYQPRAPPLLEELDLRIRFDTLIEGGEVYQSIRGFTLLLQAKVLESKRKSRTPVMPPRLSSVLGQSIGFPLRLLLSQR